MLVAPRVVERPAWLYPAAAKGEAIVVLRVRVLANGSTQGAEVESGESPFAEAAMAQVGELRFSPGTRDGVAIAGIVRLEVRYVEPVPRPPSATTEGGALVPSEPAAIAEVTVQGERPAPGVVSLTRAEVRELPGAFGDAFRAIEALPGVTPIVSGVPYFYVRGAPPGNVGYFLDGIRVPYLYHVAFGPSVVHPGMIDHVDLYPGGYPARYGRFGGGIVAGESAPPRKDFHGEANIRVFDAGALVESGFAGGKGSALVGGRYSYTGAIVSLLAKDTVIDYRDAQLRVAYDVTAKDRLSIFAFGAYDLLGETPGGKLHVLFGSEFYRADVRYDRVLAPGSALRQAITLGFDRSRVADGQISETRSIGTRTELTHRASRSVLLRAGADVLDEEYQIGLAPRADPDDPETIEFQSRYGSRRDLTLGLRGDLVLTPHSTIELTPGFRVDLFRSRGESAIGIDPRLSARVHATPKTRLLVAMGVAHQTPSFVAPIPGIQPAGLAGGLQRSYQQSFGVETDLPQDVLLRLTVYSAAFFRLSDAIGNTAQGAGDETSTVSILDRRALGSSRGVEAYLYRKLTRRVGGFVSYTLGQSLRTVGRDTFPATFDRTHVLNVVSSVDLGRRWRAGGRFVFYSGIPDQDGARVVRHPGREPSFYRLDFRVEKRWRLGTNGSISFVAEMLNATLNKETVGGEAIGPISIPSIGAEAFF